MTVEATLVGRFWRAFQRFLKSKMSECSRSVLRRKEAPHRCRFTNESSFFVPLLEDRGGFSRLSKFEARRHGDNNRTSHR